jgi:hypothetical protein
MSKQYLERLASPEVRAARVRWSGRDRYPAGSPAAGPDRLGADEVAFVAERNGFYIATTSPEGWPYLQFRGGPRGFLQALDDRTLAFADLDGNRQYLTVGHVAHDDRVALFLMDYETRSRLKILGRMRIEAVDGRRAVIAVEAFDWNCPKHIPLRIDADHVEAALAGLQARIATLEAENARLRASPR